MMQLELPHINVLTKMDLLKRSNAEVEQCVVVAQRRVVLASSNPAAAVSSSQTHSISCKSCSITWLGSMPD